MESRPLVELDQENSNSEGQEENYKEIDLPIFNALYTYKELKDQCKN